MKRKDRDRRVLLAGIGGVVAGSFLAGGKARAGVLEPPAGPIGPTMRSLSEVEPRVPVNSLTGSPDALHVIDRGGSYKLTGHLVAGPGQSAIAITCPDPVSIDLAGFTIRGAGGGGGGGGGGIVVLAPAPGCDYVEAFDGHIHDFDGDGVDGGSARVLELYDVVISNVSRGITVQGSLIVEGCHISRCSSHGIEWNRFPTQSSVFIVDDTECRACAGHGLSIGGDWSFGGSTCSITDFDAIGNLADGIHIEVLGPQGTTGGQLSGRIQAVRATINSGHGFYAQGGSGGSLLLQCDDVVCARCGIGFRLSDSTADLCDCICAYNASDGFQLENAQGAVEACSAYQNGGDGLHLLGSARLSVSECCAHDNTGAGIHLDSSVIHVSVQDNETRGNHSGFRCVEPQNLLICNTALGNSLDYDLPAAMSVVIVPQAGLAASDNPHANYSS